MRLRTIAITITVFFSVCNAQQLVRGPYLQMLTPNSIEIAWSTNEPSESRVVYGDLVSQQTIVVQDSELKTDHFITLNNLQASKNYYYSVGNSTAIFAGNSESFRFKTAPQNGSEGSYRFWAIGDFGRGNQGQRDVMNSFIQHQDTNHTDFMIWLGDNAYSSGTQIEYQNNLFNIYDSLLHYIPVFSTPGNHDYGSVNYHAPPLEHGGPYFDIINSPTAGQAGGLPSHTELYYSFDFGNIHFISLNSEILAWITDGSSQVYQWLEQDLSANTKEWVICFFHQPPYSKANHDSDSEGEKNMTAMRQNALPILEKYHVDLVLSGHSHVYERSKLIHGHYGLSSSFNQAHHAVSTASGKFDQGEHYAKYPEGSNDGTVYVVCGNSGSYYNNCQTNHPVMIASDCGTTAFGSLIIDVQGNRLDCKYLKSNGVIHDYFTIIKQEGIENSAQFASLQWHPNPTQNQITVSFNAQQSFEVGLVITDASGKEVKREYFNSVLGINNHVIDIQNLANGTYHVQLFSYKEQHSFSIIKQN